MPSSTGYPAAGIGGVRGCPVQPSPPPAEPRDHPDTIGQSVSTRRLAGVDDPYSLAPSAEAHPVISETSDHGHPSTNASAAVIVGDIIWAPPSPAPSS
ncbi:encapsulin [Sphaerisporangium rubeum]|uniref:Putative linocin/CFP29 family protein n=1 Tax=Sphaerisporangium rubeum TaxID=321317 RepID=A0A7X0IIS4_9ACTN|nr:encapsulin [Sphaerisporangium rubeum]MBB6475972.1 putative linocin/CFP29 family protein [Sphaerisporangium rubeum]